MGVLFLIIGFILIIIVLIRAIKLVLAKEKKVDKTTWKIGAAAATLVILGIITTPESSEVSSKSEEEPEEIEETEDATAEVPLTSLPIDEYVESILIDKIGEEVERGIPSVESIGIDDTLYEYETLTVVLNETVGLTVKSTRDTMLLNTLETAESVVEEYGYEGGLTFNWSVPLVDNLGNEEYGNVLQLHFSPETLSKMNFKNIAAKDLGKAADIYGEHPALSE